MTPSATGETPEPTPPIDLDALEVIARAASPGLWEYTWTDEAVELNKGTALPTDLGNGFSRPASSWNTADRLMDFDVEDFDEEEARQIACDAEHMAAARPEVMLALIERLRAAEAQARPPLEVVDVNRMAQRFYEATSGTGEIIYPRMTSKPTIIAGIRAALDLVGITIEDQEKTDER